MVSLSQARKLYDNSKKMSDPEVQKLLGQFYALAEIISDQVSIRGSNKQLRVIDSHIKEAQDGSK